MNEFEVSDDVVSLAAQACADRLAKWFGSAEQAIAELQSDPVAMAQIAMMDFIKVRRDLTLKVHMNPRPFAQECLDLIRAGGKLPA